MASISLPTGTYALPEPKASVRRLINCFAESAPDLSQDDAKNKDTPVILRRAPGVVAWADDGTSNPVRGLWVFSGTLYAVIGPTLYSVSKTGVLTSIGTNIPGTGRVHMSDNFGCLVIIVPGTTSGYTYSSVNPTVVQILSVVPSAGDTAGTLQVPWPYNSGTYSTTFSDGEVRPVTYTNNSTVASWTVALVSEQTTVDLSIGLTYGGFQPITSPTFTQFGALNLGFIDSYIVFLANNGREFYNCDSQINSGQGPITFTQGTEFPREFGTDLFTGMIVDHRTVVMFGTLTSEVYIDTGNATNSPFSSAPNNFMQMGCANGETVVQQDQSVFWLANDLTVRRMSGITPIRVSNHGIESILEQAYINDAYAFSYSIGGHLFYALTLPTQGRTLIYDCTTTEWHERSSYGLPYWRPFCSINAYGMWLVGDSKSGKIGYLDTSVFTEWGDSISSTWIHQPVYSGHNRLRHIRLEVVLGTGASTILGPGFNPQLTLKFSDNGGNTWRTMPTKFLGESGHYQVRAVWWRLGMSRERVYQFVLADPVEQWITDVQLEVLPALN